MYRLEFLRDPEMNHARTADTLRGPALLSFDATETLPDDYGRG
jgi:hypothetical protein